MRINTQTSTLILLYHIFKNNATPTHTNYDADRRLKQYNNTIAGSSFCNKKWGRI